jgi:hypothetical protein
MFPDPDDVDEVGLGLLDERATGGADEVPLPNTANAA